MCSSQPGTLFRGNGSHPLSPHQHNLFNWTGLQPVVGPTGSGYGSEPSSHLELDDLLLLHFGIIKIPITTVKVTLQKVKVKMMKKFQGY